MLHNQNNFLFTGPSKEAGPLPALFYFALSATASLTLDPFNQLIGFLPKDNLRIFSYTLPLHDVAPQEFNHAILNWKNDMVSTFIDEMVSGIDRLIEEGLVDPKHIAVAGLSRGAFIATHIASRHKHIKTILGFAPLTRPEFLEDDSLFLDHCVDSLVHKRLRFYIGNRDLRVGTDNAFTFIQKLADANYAAHVRAAPVELIIQASHGHLGHGTMPETFKEGASWLSKEMLL